jgi:Ca2+-binding EF-hand superfamily protein
MTTLDNLARKFESFEPVGIKEQEKDIAEYIDRLKDSVRNIEKVVSWHEVRIKDTFETLNQINDESIEKSELQDTLSKFKTLFNEIIQKYKNIYPDDEAKVIFEQFSPGINSRIEALIEDYEDIVENINISLECPDELEKLEKLAEEYAKKAPVADWD